MLVSPYAERPREEWPDITRRLVEVFPLHTDELLKFVDNAWHNLFNSSFGESGLQIGMDILLPAQATGVLLERLIAVEMQKNLEGWRGGRVKNEKDIVYENDLNFSFEIKTSSSRSGLYGNRSTGHRAEGRTKFRSGYYLVINYKLPTEDDKSKSILNVRFGWIDDDDWVGQTKPTGQQASIGVSLAKLKLITIRGTI
ncbi:ScaI family restriction endonuclease [Agrobacterium vitis]|uniref:ScaI family restriction endonuclease n=1 Tax=Agrobacterium vitis TaxID=373 RepID=A0AAE4WAG2_AGRVI|nr:ScaI family restriction endonuclease [Agrobacterium vitis]MCF1498531.1 ScaI family restriction endonuclease [Allorhizobium sp. Av2]MCM2438351.1 ScaI family restriction endonuclease [Agrobacterium vitis]MUZ56267.1 ScaI family restriction endonuclease [Agrobacterium vitis]MVA64596.1 ScaI family restriction endonuclease [Agrobacterium vitis]MVA85567.1 ScaI family restriction endonuclease [Agrobacterium vitis]